MDMEYNLKIKILEHELEIAHLKIERICTWLKVNHGIIIPADLLDDNKPNNTHLYKEDINDNDIPTQWPCTTDDDPSDSAFQNNECTDLRLEDQNQDFKKETIISTKCINSPICKPCVVVLTRIEIETRENNLSRVSLENHGQNPFPAAKSFDKKRIFRFRSIKKIRPSEKEKLKAVDICCTNFLNKCHLNEIIKCPVSTCPKTFQVPHQDKIYLLRATLKTHLERIHYFNRNELKTKGKIYHSNRKEKVVRKNRTMIKVHKNRTETEKVHLCPSCGRTFPFRSSLKAHINSCERHRRKSNSIQKHQCTTCNMILVTSTALKSHISAKHLKEKHFLCSICPSSFARNGTLERHMRTHTGEKPYMCEICSTSFANNSSLSFHKTTHYGAQEKEKLKKFACHICPYKFPKKSQLIRHVEAVHENVRPYKCSEPNCDKRFKSKTNLKYHIGSHYNPNRRNRGYNKPKIYPIKVEINK